MSPPAARLRRAILLSAVLAGCLAGIAGCNGRPETSGRANPDLKPYGPHPEPRWQESDYPVLKVALPEIRDAEFVNDDQLCATCHQAYTESFAHNVHRGQSCEKCHGPASRHLISRGKEPGSSLSFKKLSPPERAELCLKCHEQDACTPGSKWRTSPHAHRGVSCTDCHTSHYNVPPGTPATTVAAASRPPQHALASYRQNQPPIDIAVLREESKNLGAVTPHICYRCHASLARQQEIAHPHQICGAVGFDCRTCHDPHGKVRQETRSDLCLKCHDQSSPTMAWHSSTHSRYGVACTDCHNPHPHTGVQQLVNISHMDVRRPGRMPMSVDEPTACYKCHGDIYARNAMPSHHPIKEGKMECSSCHDPHGQSQGNLKASTVNQVCYKCHAEKQGPFAYEHPPVTENCGYCHDPHGTVANNLLHQPTTFLCLRCHTGHRTSPLGPNHNSPANGVLLGDIGTNPALQRAFFTDCTQCHSQIHGSDVPSPHAPRAFMR
ncbi:MAG: hypothetical protein HYS13_06310 [Planctomycetia bacterium]|nr:hypothetical protein [Planctomycetia bacterium]